MSDSYPRNRRKRAAAFMLALAAIFAAAPGWAGDDDASKAKTSDDGFDSKHIFGFTEGADIGEPDEHEAEFTTTGHSGKWGGGRYRALEQEATDEGALTHWLGYELTLHGAASQASTVIGLASLRQINFSGLSVEPKFTLMKRSDGAPFSLSLSFQPEWDRIDTISGTHASNFALPVRLMADAELIRERLYAGANLLYAPEIDHDKGAPTADSALLGASAALTWRLASRFSIGGTIEYDAVYASLHVANPVGAAVFLGPTLFARFSPTLFCAATWSSRIAGAPAQAGRIGDYNQSELSRQRARLTVGVEF
jgi:hypothetical protein